MYFDLCTLTYGVRIMCLSREPSIGPRVWSGGSLIRLIGQFNFDILFENMFRTSSSVFASKPHTLTKIGYNEPNIGWYTTDYFSSNFKKKKNPYIFNNKEIAH